MFSRRTFLIVGSFCLPALPAQAVMVCHDYTAWRATCKDPRPAGEKAAQGSGVSDLERALSARAYKPTDVTNTANDNPEKLQSHLKPGDVIIVAADHSGFVRPDGKIDHFIQDPNAVGKAYAADALPEGPRRSPNSPCEGGLFRGEDFPTFWAHRCVKQHKKVVIWRARLWSPCVPPAR